MMTKYDVSFIVGVNAEALSKGGMIIPVKVDFSGCPHLLIAAPSGSGKTYLLKYLLKQLADKNGTIYLCDFKGIDFISMQDCKRYFKHNEVSNGLEKVYEIMQQRMSNPVVDNKPVFLVFDEWAGFLSSLEKKQQEAYKQKMASLLMLGRGVNVFVIISLQRADSTNFLSGARDNFGNALGLGQLSNEAVRMLFPDDTDSIQPKSRGRGYLRSEGQPLTEIVVPRIRSMQTTDETIARALSGEGSGQNADSTSL